MGFPVPIAGWLAYILFGRLVATFVGVEAGGNYRDDGEERKFEKYAHECKGMADGGIEKRNCLDGPLNHTQWSEVEGV